MCIRDSVQPVQKLVNADLHRQLAAVQDVVLAHVEGAVLHKAHKAREVHLAVLTFEELLQVVVAQRAVKIGIDQFLNWLEDVYKRQVASRIISFITTPMYLAAEP